MEKEKSYAVHEKDLEDFLRSLGIYEAILDEKYECFKCSDKITMKNFQSVFPNEEEIKICCIKLDCFQKALELKRKGK